ncbi:MAG: hypothetical protein AUK21_02915 [Parcubacteria group bacterium CG2_30_48_51]|nr:MAG: hypothetical protein AUK21_02915 [Parcubacteria group bacterium CG2_30_48_51]
MAQKNLLVTLDFPPAFGGVARYYSELVKSFSQGTVMVLTVPAPGYTDNLATPVLRKKLLWPQWIWPRWLRAFFTIRAAMRKNHCTVLWAGQLLPIGTVALILSLFFGTPYVVFVHGMDMGILQGRKKRLARMVLLRASVVVANSRATEQLALANGARIHHTIVVYPCPTDLTRELRQAVALTVSYAGKPYILSVGRLVKRKGFDRVLAMLPRVCAAVPDAHYVLIGEGDERARLQAQYTSIAQRHPGIRGRVHFLGAVTDSVLATHFAHAAVFAMPNRDISGDREGFGLVYLEAALFGVPSVAGNTGGSPEAVQHQRTGIVVASDAELASALQRLLRDIPYRHALGAAAQQRAQTEFRWEAQTRKLHKALNTYNKATICIT